MNGQVLRGDQLLLVVDLAHVERDRKDVERLLVGQRIWFAAVVWTVSWIAIGRVHRLVQRFGRRRGLQVKRVVIGTGDHEAVLGHVSDLAVHVKVRRTGSGQLKVARGLWEEEQVSVNWDNNRFINESIIIGNQSN